jgi:hypothetical protein
MATPRQIKAVEGDDEVIEGVVGEVDLDLDKEDSLLREAIGKPTRVRIKGKVFEFKHMSLWLSSALDAAAESDYDTWAEDVIEDPGQREAFKELDLRIYQVKALFKELTENADNESGKSSKRDTSSRGTRTR